MNKETFINELRRALTGYEPTKREEAISYYEELIAEYLSMGKSEEDIVAGFGKIEDIVRRLGIQKVSSKESSKKEADFVVYQKKDEKKKESIQKDESNPRLSAWKCLTIIFTSVIWLPVLIAVGTSVISICLSIIFSPLLLAFGGAWTIISALITTTSTAGFLFALGQGVFCGGLALVLVIVDYWFVMFLAFVGKKIGRFLYNATKKGGWLLYEK